MTARYSSVLTWLTLGHIQRKNPPIHILVHRPDLIQIIFPIIIAS